MFESQQIQSLSYADLDLRLDAFCNLQVSAALCHHHHHNYFTASVSMETKYSSSTAAEAHADHRGFWWRDNKKRFWSD